MSSGFSSDFSLDSNPNLSNFIRIPLEFQQNPIWILNMLSGFSSEYSLDAHYNPVGITIGIVSGLSSESSKFSRLNLLFSHQNHLWILIIILSQNSHWNLNSLKVLIRILPEFLFEFFLDYHWNPFRFLIWVLSRFSTESYQ